MGRRKVLPHPYAAQRDVVAAATSFDNDERIGAILVTGSERALAAGADIKEMESKSGLEMTLSDRFGGWSVFANVRTPVIAAVPGYALGVTASWR